MSIYKRGKYYWFDFVYKGDRVQRSTHQSDRRAARKMEAACRTALAMGEAGILERRKAPRLRGFAQRFVDAIAVRCAVKPNTVSFYTKKLNRLLQFEPLANAPLDQIDEALIESYVQQRRKQVSPASVNRELATLRRLLRLAQEWKEILRVPRIRLLPGERSREFVLTHEQEKPYLDAAPQPLHDVAMLIVDTGLRVGEAVLLQWLDVHLNPASGAKFGYIHIREGKSKKAQRNLPVTDRVRVMLEGRFARAKRSSDTSSGAGSGSNGLPLWVFPVGDGGPISVDCLDKAHLKVRGSLKLSKDFVLHSLRHTMLTRLGESGVDAFTIMRIAGHSTVVVSQRYIHPSSEAVERAFERLEAINAKAIKATEEAPLEPKMLPVPAVSTTLDIAKQALRN